MAHSSFRPLPIEKQTIVITGASSGIGWATAKLAASKGANVVIAASSGEELQKCADAMEGKGWRVLPVTVDVSQMEDLSRLRDEALAAFGQINTWINNAGLALYGHLMDGDLAEERKIFEINFWGTLMGSRIAVEEMAEKGGTLINIGCEASTASRPFLGIYSASKQAVRGLTDALRIELKDRNVPVEVCLIMPTAIEVPFIEHTTDRLTQGAPVLPSLVDDPDVAARAILKCAVSPQRDVYVGGPARLSAILDTFFPKVKDIVAESRMKELRSGKENGAVKGAIRQLKKTTY